MECPAAIQIAVGFSYIPFPIFLSFPLLRFLLFPRFARIFFLGIAKAFSNHRHCRWFSFTMQKPAAACAAAGLRLSKKRQSHFYEQEAVRRAQDLSALSGQIPHLRPEKCFLRGTCPRRKRIPIFSRLRARTLRGFFDKLKPAAAQAAAGFCIDFYSLGSSSADMEASASASTVAASSSLMPPSCLIWAIRALFSSIFTYAVVIFSHRCA